MWWLFTLYIYLQNCTQRKHSEDVHHDTSVSFQHQHSSPWRSFAPPPRCLQGRTPSQSTAHAVLGPAASRFTGPWSRTWLSSRSTSRSASTPSVPDPRQGLRGNVRTPSIARWKARGWLYIRHYWTFFAISYGWDVISGNLLKSVFLKGGGLLSAQISERRERRPPITVGVRVAEWLPFSVVSIYLQYTI